jgi:ribonucleoside-triphosphate reductase
MEPNYMPSQEFQNEQLSLFTDLPETMTWEQSDYCLPNLDLNSDQRKDLYQLDQNIPWSSVGYLVFKRTYARRLPNENGEITVDSSTEEWADTVNRVISSANSQLGANLTSQEQYDLAKYMLKLQGFTAGRFLWQLGTDTVERLGLASLQNCAFTVIDEPVKPFTWAMDFLMLGSGVGFNIQKHHIDKLPSISLNFKPPVRQDNSSADFIIPDTREGWVALLAKVLKSAFLSSSKEKGFFTYSTQLIRGAGAIIKGFGGLASGPEILVEGIDSIAKILYARAGQKIRPIDALDIMNIIGSIVVAGNVRRSALIAIGDYDDIEYLNAKRWDLGNIPNWRAMSNNSVVAPTNFNDLPSEFWAGYEGLGEPYGLINLELSRTQGRLGDFRYQDLNVEGYNPCAEQSLEKDETCCLAEIALPLLESKEEFLNLTKILYKICKHSLLLDCHQKSTESIVHKNMRMGIGITGYMQSSPVQKSWLPDVYESLREFDVGYSQSIGVNPSIKLTTCKPSGTLSLLPGVVPGNHPAIDRYLIRRITVASNSPLLPSITEHGYDIEYKRNFDGTLDYRSQIVSFPFTYGESEHLIVSDQLSAIQHLEYVKELQTLWSDNSVSVTIYYRMEELPAIKEYLSKNFSSSFKTLSFLLHSGHGFDQAPFEPITKEDYDSYVARVRPIKRLTTNNVNGLSDLNAECLSGHCPVK